ncbi:hypothetical protein INS49_009591 [Diaporthe citri]|uniref:uncharacterized protein n=1 Tax=Diaporthe citri TaxID=83186 RepID=UPI001C7ECBAD|nr:uncharacterized protein INS49_009591 [Diaporthe citri]KAG6361364.1 hypothetical protein INS49_009591 [Diaporthe citri]
MQSYLRIPGDETWPSSADWQTLNSTVGGRLVATIPQASVCHATPYANYDEAACSVVVKNTGHDYNGKSTGKGALSLWMRNLKTTETITSYQSKAYTGPAIKLGAGVLVGETHEAAAAEGYRAVGGECGSVGIAGGYSQGGGHSILNSKYGMGTDQVLEWEVVTARGEHLIATPEQNTDLYWALGGGGGGTYGVVLSMTTRLHKDGPFTGGSLGFTLEDAGNNAAIPQIGNNIGGALDLVRVDSVCEGILREVFDDDVVIQGGIRYVHEVGDIVIPLVGMESSEYLLTTNGVDKVNGNVSEYGRLTGTAEEPVSKSLDVLPMQVWIKKAAAAGMHPAVAELIQAMDAPGTSVYPKLHKKTACTSNIES